MSVNTHRENTVQPIVALNASNKFNRKNNSTVDNSQQYDNIHSDEIFEEYSTSSKGKQKYTTEENINHEYTAEELQDIAVESIDNNCSKVINLPTEIMIGIFSFLDTNSLDNCSLVCQNWYHLLNDDTAWRLSFSNHFGTEHFNRVSSSLKWRTELIKRQQYLRKWRRKNVLNVSFNGNISFISHVYTDFDAKRIIAFSDVSGLGVVADPSKGRLASPKIYIDSNLRSTSEVVVSSGSRFGLICGLESGRVCVTLFSRQTRNRDRIMMTDYHRAVVTAVWINQFESSKQAQQASVNGGSDSSRKHVALSADANGSLYSWSLNKGLIECSYEICPGISITHIQSDSKDSIVVRNALGQVFYKSRDKEAFIKVGEEVENDYEHSILTKAEFEVDFASGFVLSSDGFKVVRYSIPGNDDNSISSLSQRKFSDPNYHDGFYSPVVELVTSLDETGLDADCVDTIIALSIDKTISSGGEERVPGDYGRFAAAATRDGYIYIWDITSKPKDGKIKPTRVLSSPFYVNETVPSITSIALNSLVLLAGSYNGMTVAYDLLTGNQIRVISSRFSRKALDLSNEQQVQEGIPIQNFGLVPVSYLGLDMDPNKPQGVIVVGSAIQYFDFGSYLDSKSTDRNGSKKKGVRKRRMVKPGSLNPDAISKHEINKGIELELERLRVEQTEEDELSNMLTEFNGDGMTEEEQIQMALVMSESQKGAEPVYNPLEDKSYHSDNEELIQAIEASRIEAENLNDNDGYEDDYNYGGSSQTQSQSHTPYHEDNAEEIHENDSFERLYNQVSSSSLSAGYHREQNGSILDDYATVEQDELSPSGQDENYDEDFEFALRLSLAEAESLNQSTA
ncbi:hypothetical protein NADFUDRAFT_81285 [Nadsonia fulvescens var. elongata DSM 6958]|uniref:F-box domain-containing protein n=1 Tax=Nadsonia fulvescens var. elongata DSM 6958 TaxID=857566 RepID=A0A1E3PTW3_9ASCO|nr:hypothetical protein NADFUDRAFT_81285 [Nadsonia fulvescens var. elongata DSM 6958]